eukprot:CAMPEP_0175644210 /NCGR_PEP_ID=MMETSP0097-20121207/6192_1 /TAXON_ID=311494 /ORGANISM="Alexandrium monilatum, Strain CCMP3105" /LENGTH=499 /DNA_ID=CAMNT_0016950077 /DNA_START=42 /DNA_END=1542 /DNA_ORIENTATION=+
MMPRPILSTNHLAGSGMADALGCDFPGIAQNLGWLLTVVFIVGLFPISLYVSILMARTRHMFVEMAQEKSLGCPPPQVGTMGEVARCAFGNRAATTVYVLVYGFNLLGQASYLLVLGTSFQQVFWSTPMCITTAVAIGCAVLLIPIFSIRRLGESVVLCFCNTVIIGVVIVVALANVASLGGASCHETFLVPPGLTAMTVLGQVTNVLYAFTGQWMYFELMDTMSDPREFPYAFVATGPTMVTMYLAVALISYAIGASHEDLLASMRYGVSLRVVALLLFVHVGIVYLIKSVVLARYFHGLCSPGDVERRSTASFLRHGGWGVAMLVFGYLVSNAVPFFSNLLGLIGGLLAGPINFIIPIVFYLAALMRQTCGTKAGGAHVETGPGGPEGGSTEYGACTIEGVEPEEESFTTESTHASTAVGPGASTLCAALRTLPWWELAMMAATLVLTLLTMALGFSDQVIQVLKKENTFGAPFSCHALVIPDVKTPRCPAAAHVSP